ncbi:hypothetical protein BC835DRAFT_1404305 [Cytidiella melzeri]|nr:hypothetical protein BC835DRAFT_1404305 [Cytidiella melzeri]
MAAVQNTFGDLSLALAQAITYLTRCLIARYSATTIIKLQLALETNLKAQFESSWVPSDPLRGSGRRCLTLSPSGVPPRAIYMACKTAGVDWSVWATLLGGIEFDLFVDPGCVSVRFGNWDMGKTGKFFTVWSQETVEVQEAKAKKPTEVQLQAQLKAQAAARVIAISSKTFAQQLILQDADEDDELFSMLADEIREPTWITPIASQFPSIPAPARSDSSSPVSVISTHSRSSSCSSSSGFSFSTCGSSDSYGSATTVSLSSASNSPCAEKPSVKLSRRERARQAKVFVDSSKTEVTNYDGGKTTVLTGGVMLGGGPKTTTSASSDNWRRL